MSETRSKQVERKIGIITKQQDVYYHVQFHDDIYTVHRQPQTTETNEKLINTHWQFVGLRSTPTPLPRTYLGV